MHPREAIRSDLHCSYIVEAAAGTGKTYELVQRSIALLAEGAGTIDRLAVITFTEKAAGELKIRLRTELELTRQASVGDTKIRLETAITRLEEATIDTIHGFCREILSIYPIEAGIDPAFEVEAEGVRFAQKTFRAWFARQLDDPPPGLERFLSRGRIRARDRTPSSELEQAVGQLVMTRHLPAPWPRPSFELEAQCHDLGRQIQALAQLLRTGAPEDPMRLTFAPLDEMARWLEHQTSPPSEQEAQLVMLQRAMTGIYSGRKGHRGSSKMGYGPFSDTVDRPTIIAAGKQLEQALKTFVELADQDLAAELREELREVEDAYLVRIRRFGSLDFQDLLVLTRNLIRDRPDLRRHLQQRYQHLLVDEFQDTDPIQAEIILLLSSQNPDEKDYLSVSPAPGKLTLVGDPKQSIYGFRGADLSLYRKVRDALSRQGVRTVVLDTSHRSIQPLQQFINAAFTEPFSADPSGPGYVALTGGPDPIAGQPSTIALPVPLSIGPLDTVWASTVDALIPETVAGFIDWLLRKSSYQVRGADGLRPMVASDICLLFRSIQRAGELLTQPFEARLQARRIDTVLVGARALHGRDEIETLLTVLEAIEWPNDELSVYGALRGPFFSFLDEDLFRWRTVFGPLHPFRMVNETLEDRFQAIDDALLLLRELARQRNRQPFAETIQELLKRTRSHIRLGLQPGGARVLAHIERVVDLARRFEDRLGFSFRAFVQYLRAEADEPRTHEGVVNESGVPGIRMMTVHKAKGLEFPVVILADPMVSIRSTASQYTNISNGLNVFRLAGLAPKSLVDHRKEAVQREQAESLRLAYVACTRARDMLVVPCSGTSIPALEQRSWLRPVLTKLRPPRDEERNGEDAEGVPDFGEHSLVPRPDHTPPNVRPGRHRFGNPGIDVVWWDPNVLPVAPAPTYGLQYEQFLADGPKAQQSLDAYRTWSNRLDEARAGAQEQSIVLEDLRIPPIIQTGPTIAPLRSVLPDSAPAKGPRYHQLVHRLLQQISLKNSPEEVDALAHFHARTLAANEVETSRAIQAIKAFLADDVVERARTASICHRNYPILGLSEVGTVLDTSVQLLFREDHTVGGWIVADCTTSELPEAQLRAKMQHVLQVLSNQHHTIRAGILLCL